jgi:hypothetical protein
LNQPSTLVCFDKVTNEHTSSEELSPSNYSMSDPLPLDIIEETQLVRDVVDIMLANNDNDNHDGPSYHSLQSKRCNDENNYIVPDNVAINVANKVIGNNNIEGNNQKIPALPSNNNLSYIEDNNQKKIALQLLPGKNNIRSFLNVSTNLVSWKIHDRNAKTKIKEARDNYLLMKRTKKDRGKPSHSSFKSLNKQNLAKVHVMPPIPDENCWIN